MKEFMAITKALADQNRVRILMALRRRELCVCQITELFGLAPSTVSKHLSLLHQAGLVESRKENKWVYYRLPDSDVSSTARWAIDWTAASNQKAERIIADGRELQRILKIDPVELCKKQCPK